MLNSIRKLFAKLQNKPEPYVYNNFYKEIRVNVASGDTYVFEGTSHYPHLDKENLKVRIGWGAPPETLTSYVKADGFYALLAPTAEFGIRANTTISAICHEDNVEKTAKMLWNTMKTIKENGEYEKYVKESVRVWEEGDSNEGWVGTVVKGKIVLN